MLFKQSVLLVVVFVSILNANACDLCSTYLGINPDDYRNSFGLVNRLRYFETTRTFQTQNYNPYARLSHLGIGQETTTEERTTYKESFNSYDIWGKFFINPRLQLNGMVSFTDNYQYVNDSITNNIAGIGDLLVLAKYQIYSSRWSMDTVNWFNRLTIGGGMKLPVGSFNKTGMQDDIDPHLQPGTGSVDYLILIEYLTRYKKVGLNTNLTYKFNTTNNNNFRFADRLNYNVSLFALATTKKTQWMPNAGISAEYANRDELNNERHLGSGGEAIFPTAGLKVFFNNFIVGATAFFAPLHEDLYDESIQVQNRNRIITELTYVFN